MRRIWINIVLLSVILLISGCILSQMPAEQVLFPFETTFISYEEAASWLRIAEKFTDDKSKTLYLTVERCGENYEEVIDTREYTICLADGSCIYTSIVTRESN